MYSLTFDELQNTRAGKAGFGSMNMDEFLQNILTAQEIITPSSCSASGLQLPRTLTQKTVDEVWRGMAKESGDDLGEMTLDDFLFKAEVDGEDDHSYTQLTSTASNDNAGFGFGFQETDQQNMGFIFSNAALPYAIPAVATAQLSSPSVGCLEQGLNGNLVQGLNGTRGRRRSGSVEKVVDRRQRRMIKNRESAARSRARKQAYTAELETELAKLKEENQELQNKHVEIKEIQKQQILEMINKQPESKRRRLRRTHTGP